MLNLVGYTVEKKGAGNCDNSATELYCILKDVICPIYIVNLPHYVLAHYVHFPKRVSLILIGTHLIDLDGLLSKYGENP